MYGGLIMLIILIGSSIVSSYMRLTSIMTLSDMSATKNIDLNPQKSTRFALLDVHWRPCWKLPAMIVTGQISDGSIYIQICL